MDGQSPASADGWVFEQVSLEPRNAARDATLFALANGDLGVRGSIDELPGLGASFLPDAYDRQPIAYHERFAGFADSSDTRLSCPDVVAISIALDNEPVDFGAAQAIHFSRRLDLRAGLLRRMTRWMLGDGRELEIVAERLVPIGGGATVFSRIAVTPVGFTATIAVGLPILPSHAQLDEADSEDPRISARAGARLETGFTVADPDGATLLMRTIDQALFVAVAQCVGPASSVRVDHSSGSPVQQVVGHCAPGLPLTINRVVTFATDRNGGGAANASAKSLARAAQERGFDDACRTQRIALDHFWTAAAPELPGDPELERAIRFNLFHLFQSASRADGHSVAAKGLTGEGYEGHYFWDTEAYALPVLALTGPALARHVLMYRVGTLDLARANARALNHRRGALYPWRTIAGAECSAHYPTGAAQYHINAAIACAIEFYCAATKDDAFLFDHGAEVVIETARLWLDVGHFSARRGDAFMIHGVTGPDEYSALVDNNFYTNAMAQRHLRYAVKVAARLASEAPAAWAALAARLAIVPDEIDDWARAAERMYLPRDERLGISPQDDTFLEKPIFDFAAVPPENRPLLLHYHPMTLFRHQLCKQGDVVQAMVSAGDAFGLGIKARNYAYYEPLTTHDSTLSPSPFAILAAEIGRYDDALRFHRETALVDIEDRLHNAGHGAHMAAMAGSWLVLVQGWGGLRVIDGEAHFRPVLPADWPSYAFRLAWRGSIVSVEVDGKGTTYRLVEGVPVTVHDRTRPAKVSREGVHFAPAKTEAVIFDLDGVLTDTARAHCEAWQRLCDADGLPFDAAFNERLKGVDRAGSLRLILENAGRTVDPVAFAAMTDRKNATYRALIEGFSPGDLFEGARDLLLDCRRAGLRIGLASASRSAPELLARLGIADLFDHVVDAGQVARSKPDPEIFLAAALALGVAPSACVGIEDATAGITAIKAAGMRAIGIGTPAVLSGADVVFARIDDVTIDDLLTAAPAPVRQSTSAYA
jgi:beta-phosphoglucomutase